MTWRFFSMAGAALVISCATPGATPPTAPAVPAVVTAPQTRVAAGGAGAEPAPRSDAAVDGPPRARLDDRVTPVSYSVELAVDPRRQTYTGEMRIDLRIAEPVTAIWLHGKDLQISGGWLGFANGTSIGVSAPMTAPGDFLGFALDRPVQPGQATLHLEFSARFGDRVGVFRQVGGDELLVFTDFEPIDARRAFPCFDEPRFKTPWTITLLIPASMDGFSNMPVETITPVGQAQKRIRFGETPPLPSYLIAFAVGRFDVLEIPSSVREESARSGSVHAGTMVPLRLIVPPGKRDWARDAATMAPELLRIVADYVAAPVPFPKLDLIAVPTFNGAMENPGLITVAASILLSDPKTPSIAHNRFLALVLAHELAHLWFGDLVTLRDWNDLWLNEGFATWLADKALFAWNARRMPHVDQVIAKNDAMLMDEHAGQRAVRQVGDTRDAVEAAFDPLSYKKAGALLAMLEAWLSEATFRRAVLAYIAAHQGGNVTMEEWAQALSAASGRDVRATLKSFLDRPGVPLVRAELRCDSARPRVELSQTAYLLLSDQANAAGTGQPWHVPVCVGYGTGSGSRGRACMLLEEKRATLELDAATCPEWLIPNAGASGYYRYAMPVAQLTALARAPLDEREAVDLVHNLRALLYAGAMAPGDVLAMLRDLSHTPGRHAHQAIVGLLQEVGDTLVPPGGRDAFAAYVRALYSRKAQVLGFSSRPGEPEEDTLLRPDILLFVGRHGADRRVRSTAQRLAKTWLGTGAGIERGMIGTTLSLAALDGDERLYEQMLAELRRAALAGDRDRAELLFRGLAAFDRPELVERSLTLLDDGTLGEAREALVRELVALPATRQRALDFLLERRQRFSSDRQHVPLLLAPLVGVNLCSNDEVSRVVTAATSVQAARPIVAPYLEQIAKAARACAGFRAANAPGAADFFR